MPETSINVDTKRLFSMTLEFVNSRTSQDLKGFSGEKKNRFRDASFSSYILWKWFSFKKIESWCFD